MKIQTLVVTSLFFCAISAFADAVFTTDPTTFQIANPVQVNPGSHVTDGSFTDGKGNYGTQFTVPLTIGNTTFSNAAGDLLAMMSGYDVGEYGQGMTASPVFDGYSNPSNNADQVGILVSFAAPVTAIGMDVSVAQVSSPVLISLSDGQTFTTQTVGGYSCNGQCSANTYSFVGIESDTGISSFTVSLPTDSVSSSYVVLGNLEYGTAPSPVPEPCILPLLGAGILSSFAFAQHKRSKDCTCAAMKSSFAQPCVTLPS